MVSVLMTSYNRANYISQAIESVINSTYKNWELIIVDDCSSDNTLTIAKEYEAIDNRIKVYQNKINLGDYPNRNKAASYANGKYLKYVDSDDYIYPDTLLIMVSVMENYPEVAIAVSSRYEEVKKNTVNILKPKDSYLQHFFKRKILDHGPSGVIIKAEIFKKADGFIKLRNISDIDLWLRIAAQNTIAEIESGLVYWREHPGQEINIANDVYLKYTFPILKKNLESKNCPINIKLVRYILLREKKMLLLNLLKYFKRTSDKAVFKQLLKENGLTWWDYLILPFLKIYTSPKIYIPKLA